MLQKSDFLKTYFSKAQHPFLLNVFSYESSQDRYDQILQNKTYQLV